MREKLAEYEIFQKLQLKETSKIEKKKVECTECGQMFPVNTIKRHLQKHEKEALMAEIGLTENVEKVEKPKPKETKPKRVKCSHCKKMFPSNTIKRHEAKHLKEQQKVKDVKTKEKEEKDDHVDDRIPCPQCNKMFPKMIMKRHLMKHETVSESSDTEKADEQLKPSDKPAKGRKKVDCSECGMAVAPNVLKRHLEKHAKSKDIKKEEDISEMYAPIEITPTKEYWEFKKEKDEKSLDFPSDSEQSVEDTENLRLPLKKAKKETVKKGPKKNQSAPVNKSVQDLKEAEKAKNTSEEESEGENSLDSAIRKIVSYKMTPKQALSHYNIDTKVKPKTYCCTIYHLYLFII